ncbi:hypothetical protein M0813_00981 [Anaeramoeba flamelloides]|uniref:Uncharacterized protein n=1 Tax=Anaeramoeba flamelloides TaxID=1746091 RepID=A0ABQ8X0J3_9EUKA|nr:hypothetical protein M0813_00981 [Anaeramoeba flamelloides]
MIEEIQINGLIRSGSQNNGNQIFNGQPNKNFLSKDSIEIFGLKHYQCNDYRKFKDLAQNKQQKYEESLNSFQNQVVHDTFPGLLFVNRKIHNNRKRYYPNVYNSQNYQFTKCIPSTSPTEPDLPNWLCDPNNKKQTQKKTPTNRKHNEPSKNIFKRRRTICVFHLGSGCK